MCQRCEKLLEERPSSNPWWNHHVCLPLDKKEEQELFQALTDHLSKSIVEDDYDSE